MKKFVFENRCFFENRWINRFKIKSPILNIAVFLKIAELTKYFEKVCFWKSLFFLKIASSKCFLRRPATWTRRKYGSSRMLKNEYVEHNVILEGVFMLILIPLFTYRKGSNWMKLLVEVRRGVMLKGFTLNKISCF